MALLSWGCALLVVFAIPRQRSRTGALGAVRQQEVMAESFGISVSACA